MSNTKDLAVREFKVLKKTVKDAIIVPFEKEILALVDKFGKSGQSGGSAPYTATAISQAVKALLLQEPICDITGIDEEWNDCGDMGDKETYQNNRLSSVFKQGKDGKPYYLDAIVFKGQNGSTFTSNSVDLPNGEKLASRQFIKLPFKPKTFYVDVIETEWADQHGTVEKAGGGWWTSKIKDASQLDEVFEYYEKQQ
tara:strand:+ start:109 stop:699 length:591 start_codon:yes stop_codon:yes gene_type:complete